jgi:hypothetical protein
MVSAIVLAAPLVHASEQGLQTVIAEVIGRSITLRDLDAGNVPNEAKASTLDDETLKRMRQKKLRDLVWTAVFEDYAKQRRIEPTPAEIDSNIRNSRRMGEELRVKRDKERATLTQELRSPDLSEARRKQAQQHLDNLNRIQEHDARLVQERADPAREKIWQESEQRVVKYSVKSWKINQALHREFGGRLVFQQAGFEPIDAYRKLLEQYEGRKAFVIRDPVFRDAVYSYFQHNFYYADEAKARFYFEKPWWERTATEMKAAGF